jgi:hypothetical protein
MLEYRRILWWTFSLRKWRIKKKRINKCRRVYWIIRNTFDDKIKFKFNQFKKSTFIE